MQTLDQQSIEICIYQTNFHRGMAKSVPLMFGCFWDGGSVFPTLERIDGDRQPLPCSEVAYHDPLGIHYGGENVP